MEDFKFNIIQNFNGELGYSLDKLENLEDMHEKLLVNKSRIEEKVNKHIILILC